MWDYKIKVEISELVYSKDAQKVSNDLRWCQISLTEEEKAKLQVEQWLQPSGQKVLELKGEDCDIFIQKLILGNDAQNTDSLELQIANLSKSTRTQIKTDQDITIYLGAGRFPDFELMSVFTGKISKVRHDFIRPDVITTIWAQPAVFNLMRITVPVTFSIPVGRRAAGRLVSYFDLLESVLGSIFGSALTLDRSHSSPELDCVGVICEIDSVWTIEAGTSTRMIIQKIIEELAQAVEKPLLYSFTQTGVGKFSLSIRSRKEANTHSGYSLDFTSGLLSFESENDKDGDKFRSESVLLPKAAPQDLIEINPNIEDFEPKFGTKYLIEKVEHRIDTSFQAITILTLSPFE